MTRDFLLSGEIAKKLYHEHAAKMPIVDYHCHVSPKDIDEDKLMETALEAGAEDFAAEGEVFEIYTEPDDLYAVKEALEAAGYAIMSAEKDKIPSNYVTLESEDDIKFMGLLIEHLEDDDDVMNVYHNWEE